MFERLCQCFHEPTSSTSTSPTTLPKSKQCSKCWLKDRQFCVTLFERARLFISFGMVRSVDRIELEQFVKQYDLLTSIESLDRSIPVAPRKCSTDDDDSTGLVEVNSREGVPKRIVLTFALMAFTVLVSAVTCSLVDRTFPVGSTVSVVNDFVIMSTFTTAAFLIISRLWLRRVHYIAFLNFLLRNLIELPAIYCQPKQLKRQINEDSCAPELSVATPMVTNLITPDRSITTFKMAPVKNREWHRIMGYHFRTIIFMGCYTAYSAYSLTYGSYRTLEATSTFGFGFCGFVSVGFCLQALFFVLYPLVHYAYICFCIVLYIQSEHLNQFIRRIRDRCRAHQLPLKEELDLMRVWHCRVARCVLDFDRFSHPIFFLLYAGQIAAMLIKSLQVNAIFKVGAFTVESYFCFARLGLYCFATIHLMQLVYRLNKSIGKPSDYLAEIGMHSAVDEPYAFMDYLRQLSPRFAHHHCQLTFLRITPIGKEFFVVTSFFVLSAVASFGSFGQLLLQVNHQLHLLL